MNTTEKWMGVGIVIILQVLMFARLLITDTHKAKKQTLLLLVLATLTGCGTVKYQSTNIGMQNVSPFTDYGFTEATASGYLISVVKVGPGYAHVQPIFSLDGKSQVLGVGYDVPLDPLVKQLFK